MAEMKRTPEMKSWRVQSPDSPGFHTVVAPDRSASVVSYIFRLNLQAGETYELSSGKLEMAPVLIKGSAQLSGHPILTKAVKRFDSFYIPAETTVAITAGEDCVFYIGGAEYAGIGDAFFRAYDRELPLGDIHQIHGSGAGEREVMFTLDPGTPASRLICGLTWGSDGGWTSWPAHQHENDLEEVYCYFDMPAPRCGFHLAYLESGGIADCVPYFVQSGTMVQAPRGYHPTVAVPGTRNAYFWVLVAFEPKSRRYDLAVSDPALL